MKKDRQVVMLPTEKATSHISMRNEKGTYGREVPFETLGFCNDLSKIDKTNDLWTSQHLYFTTNETIKGKDPMVPCSDVIGQWHISAFDEPYLVDKYNYEATIKNKCKKIVATTNPILWKVGIPKIGLDFIEKFVKEWNYGNRIKWVRLEYETNDNHNLATVDLKLRSNGTVIISPIDAFIAKDYIENHGDFKKYYDSTQKRNIWVLGYFGGGAINISQASQLAKEYSRATGVPLQTVLIDEVLSSRRFKGFKFLFSTTEQQKEQGADEMENVYAWLRD